MNKLAYNQKGVAMYLTFWIMSLLLGISLGISSMLFSQIGLLRDIGESAIAFAATDAGIEHVLYLDTSICGDFDIIDERVNCLKDAVIPLGEQVLGNGATYELTIDAEGEDPCPMGVNYCARSLGIYRDARRAIRVAR